MTLKRVPTVRSLEPRGTFNIPRKIQRFLNLHLGTLSATNVRYHQSKVFELEPAPVLLKSIFFKPIKVCGGTLSHSATLASPNYPDDYSNYATCSWYLESSNKGIALYFTSFVTEEEYDYVTVD